MTARGGGVALEVARAGLQLPPDAYNIDVKHSGLDLFTAAFGQWYALDANQVVNTRPGGYSVVRPNAKGVNSFHGTLD